MMNGATLVVRVRIEDAVTKQIGLYVPSIETLATEYRAHVLDVLKPAPHAAPAAGTVTPGATITLVRGGGVVASRFVGKAAASFLDALRAEP